MVSVKSEVKKLKKVLIHTPKDELGFSNNEMTSFLFDEYPDKDIAYKEHLNFIKLLNDNGVHTVELMDLMAETLDENPQIKDDFIKQFVKEANLSRKDQNNAYSYFSQYKDNRELVKATNVGFINNGVIVVDPLPNLYFTRDHFAFIGNGVALNHMYTETRRRETIYGEYILNYHKDFKDVPKYYDRYFKYNLEGGDVMNLNEKTLLVGSSQRSQTKGVKDLANQIFDSSSTIETVYAIDIPHSRACMHLDTVFTQVDDNKFVIFPKIMGKLDVIKHTKEKDEVLEITLQELLENELKQEVTLIKCGGDDINISKLEQWYDGCNTLAIDKGKVIAYKRNVVTNSLLKENGIEVIELDATELAKGRGGARCMSMPIIREE